MSLVAHFAMFSFAGFMSWCLVIPFDTMKTIVQAEIDPVKHGDMTQLFKAKKRVIFFHIFPVFGITTN